MNNGTQSGYIHQLFGNGITGSECLLCGSHVGYSRNADTLRIAEDAHRQICTATPIKEEQRKN